MTRSYEASVSAQRLGKYLLAALACALCGVVLLVYDNELDLSVLYPLQYYGALATVATLCVTLHRWLGPFVTVPALLVVLAGVAFGVTDHGRKEFMRDFSRVHVGMTREQVEQLMGRWLRGTGWPGNPYAPEMKPGGDDVMVFRPRNPGDDSTWAIFELRDGRVAKIRFDPD